MLEIHFKQQIGKFILFSNICIFILILTISLLGGFDASQIKELLQLLIPVKTVYMTAIVKYVIANKNDTLKPENSKQTQINKFYKTTANLFVYGYIILIVLAIFLRGVFGLYGYDTMKFLIAIIETFFGAYIGLIITDMFKIEKPKKDNVESN